MLSAKLSISICLLFCSFTAVHCFDYGNVGNQPVALNEYCVEYRLKELQETMDITALAVMI